MGKECPSGILGAVLFIVAKLVDMIVTFQWFGVVQRLDFSSAFAMSMYLQYGSRKGVNIGEDCLFCRLCGPASVGLFLEPKRGNETRNSPAATRHAALSLLLH